MAAQAARSGPKLPGIAPTGDLTGSMELGMADEFKVEERTGE